jgi:hypothetical protein
MFTQDDIDRARKFVKIALARNPFEYNTPSNYPDWFPSQSILKPPPQRSQGLLGALAETGLGGVNYLLDPVRAAVGLSPGRSMMRNWGRGAMNWLGGKAFQETTPEWQNFETFGEGPSSINMGFLNKPLRTLNPAISWLNSRFYNIDPASAWAARQDFGPQGWSQPLMRAAEESEQQRGAFTRYMGREYPTIMRMVSEPQKYFQELQAGPMEF